MNSCHATSFVFMFFCRSCTFECSLLPYSACFTLCTKRSLPSHVTSATVLLGLAFLTLGLGDLGQKRG